MNSGEVFITGIVDGKIEGFARVSGVEYNFEMGVGGTGKTELSLDDIRSIVLGNIPRVEEVIELDPNNRLVQNEAFGFSPELRKIFNDIGVLEAKYLKNGQKTGENGLNSEGFEELYPRDYAAPNFASEEHEQMVELAKVDPVKALVDVIDILAELGAFGYGDDF